MQYSYQLFKNQLLFVVIWLSENITMGMAEEILWKILKKYIHRKIKLFYTL